MVFNLILNGSNVSNGTNTFYSKDFINGGICIPSSSQICVSQIVIPYSWYNITATYSNNVFSYIWNGYYPSVILNGTMSGTTFTGTADSGSSGTFVTGQLVIGSNLTAGTVINTVTSQTSLILSNTYSGTAPTVLTGIPTFTGTIAVSGGVATLTLLTTVTGTFALNTVLYSSNTSLVSNVYIVSLKSGTLGAVNSTYILSTNQTTAIGSSFKFGFIGTYNSFTIPDGFYTMTDTNNYIQTQMLSKNQYLYNSTTGQNYYFCYVYTNSVYYQNQFILTPLPNSFSQFTTANSGNSYTCPTGFAFSALGYTPQIVISDYFSVYIGLTAGTYPSSPSAASQNVSSSYTPNGTTVNSILIHCNLVNNSVASPSDIVDVIPINNTTFGANINYQPSYAKWVSLMEGTYNNIFIYLTDQDGNNIYALDSNVTISLLLEFGQDIPQPYSPPIVNSITPLDFNE